jgi:hypothetical protein
MELCLLLLVGSFPRLLLYRVLLLIFLGSPSCCKRQVCHLPISFANLQSIKTSHRSSTVISRSFERKYSPGASSSGDDMSGFGFGLILILNHHASCLIVRM